VPEHPKGSSCHAAAIADFWISDGSKLIAPRDDRHLLHDPDGVFAPTLYPQGFSAGRLIEVVETQAVWLDL
jgi:hypothetical protein